MTTPSAVGTRRLSFGILGEDRAPSKIEDAKQHFIAQLDHAENIRNSSLLSSTSAMQFISGRADAIKSGQSSEFIKQLGTNHTFSINDISERFLRVSATRFPLIERLSLYWLNYFTFAGAASPFGPFSSSFEWEAIRPNLSRKFYDMLLAATIHPQMLFYLNARNSIGPNSPRGKFFAEKGSRKGINENQARELLELHTLGVNGGYSQEDIIELAKAMTGWTVNTSHRDMSPEQRLQFDSSLHEPGTRIVLGRRYPDDGPNQLKNILRDLASMPQTATRVANRLAAHFIGDSAPAEFKRNLARIYLETDGDLYKISKFVVNDDIIWTTENKKIRPPLELLCAAARLLEQPPLRPAPLAALTAMGQPYMQPDGPNGWNESDNAWGAPDSIKSRLDWSAEFAEKQTKMLSPVSLLQKAFGSDASQETRQVVEEAPTAAQSLTLLLMSPEIQRR